MMAKQKPEVIGKKGRMRRKEYRDAYVDSHTRISFRFQLRAMRKARGWTQAELAERAGMPPNVINRLESTEKHLPTMPTLIRLANAFDTALIVSFAPFSELLERTKNLSSEALNAKSWGDEYQGERHTPDD